MFFNIFVVLFHFNSILGISYDFGHTVDIKTSCGLMRGQSIRVLNTTINQFLGIPYAQPPTGGLRFAKPVPIVKPFEGVIDAMKPRHSCMQTVNPYLVEFEGNITTSEDCLLLNIWSPESDDKNSNHLKPVMFWIHGGGLSTGSIFSKLYNGSALAAHGVVLVTINYRLGNFGFLYGADETAPGNVGHYDQLLALKWVRENIHLFGGDKDQITIFGESAGSGSVSALILSPLSRRLFKRAITESGTYYRNKKRPILSKSEALNRSKRLSKSLNCSDSKEWLDCLRRVDANVLVKHTLPITSAIDEGTEYLPISAQKSFATNDYNLDIDLIAGTTRDEGSALGWESKTLNRSEFHELVNQLSLYVHDISADKVVDFYMRNLNKNTSDAIKWAYFDFLGDILIKCPTYLFAKQYAKHNPDKGVYLYELTYMTKNMGKIGCSDKYTGICHTADVELVFGLPVLTPNDYTKDDMSISLDIMKMWTNFAKTGKPNNDWPKLNPNSVAKVKDLNPFKTNHYLNDPFINCDTFWDKYFN